MTSVREIARQLTEKHGTPAAAVAVFDALHTMPSPGKGMSWDSDNLPDHIAERIIASAERDLSRGSEPAPIQELIKAQDALDKADEELRKARQVRDDAIRRARRANVPMTRVLEVTGLKRAQASNIANS
ncbi:MULTISPECIES: hypothetical protein [Corynebacterium]|uniref:hypothetical protein n=1 Tax=Corynebacterium TaxID=1716 RepID=UPI0025433505|nr:MULTISPECIES: hypothetical protein [Corynebacterium]MDK4328428.1 hypothetical protein [Corynebacterium pseudodiphtheriticum]WKS45824.1 hypothetical protein NLL36_04750 [Corynebacterium propinquum]